MTLFIVCVDFTFINVQRFAALNRATHGVGVVVFSVFEMPVLEKMQSKPSHFEKPSPVSVCWYATATTKRLMSSTKRTRTMCSRVKQSLRLRVSLHTEKMWDAFSSSFIYKCRRPTLLSASELRPRTVLFPST